jgi:hypothetical protein
MDKLSDKDHSSSKLEVKKEQNRHVIQFIKGEYHINVRERRRSIQKWTIQRN